MNNYSKFLVIALVCCLPSCSSLDEITVDSSDWDPTFYKPLDPKQITINPVNWKVITKSNASTICNNNDPNFVLYTVDQQGFQNNLLNLQDALRYISEDREIVRFLEKYNDEISSDNSDNN